MRFAVAGLLAIGMVSLVQAQPGGFGRGQQTSVTFLITVKAVQEDLKITEEQTTKLKDWSKEFAKKAGEILKDKGVEFTKGTKIDEEMLAKMASASTAINAEAYKQLGDVLKKEQVTRLKEIQRQAMSLAAFADAETVAALKLTDTQKTSVKGITADLAKDSKEIRDEAGKGKGFDPETMKKIAKVQKEAFGKTTDLLDDAQKKTWKELTGETFDVTKLQFQFPKKKD